jgi:hypothetical protein
MRSEVEGPAVSLPVSVRVHEDTDENRAFYLRSALQVERKVNSNDSRGIFSIKG